MNEDIENLLSKWHEAKQEIAGLEKKIEKYKSIATNIMDKENVDILTSNNFVLNRKDQNRTTISRKDLPEEIWNTYCKELFYHVFYISKKGENKLRRSIRRKRSPKK